MLSQYNLLIKKVQYYFVSTMAHSGIHLALLKMNVIISTEVIFSNTVDISLNEFCICRYCKSFSVLLCNSVNVEGRQ